MAKVKLLLLIILLSAAPYQGGRPAQTGSIEGNVVVAGSSRALPGVSVFLAGPPSNVPEPVVRSITDVSGHFSFQNIASPRASYYRVGAEAFGYEGIPEEVPFKAGQTVHNIVVTMMTGGTIRGRITDGKSAAVVGTTVFVYREAHDLIDPSRYLSPYRVTADGFGYLRSVNRIGTDADLGQGGSLGGGSYASGTTKEAIVQTDKDGNYILQRVPAGQYIIGVEFPFGYTPNPNGFATTYYPGVTDSTKARPIVVEPEGKIIGIDFVVQKPVRYQISGTVENYNGSGSAIISLHLPGANRKMAPTWGANVNSDGKFEIRNVIPGSYELTVRAGTNLAAIPIGVSGNVGGIVLRMPNTTNVTGKLSVVLRRGDAKLPSPVRLAVDAPGLPSAVQMSFEGSFVMREVALGKRYVYQMFAPEGYVLDIHQGLHDVGDDHLIEVGHAMEPLAVTVRPADFGMVVGTVKAKTGGTKVASILLVPDGLRRASAANYYEVRTKSDGSFKLENVLPGAYTLLGWEFGRVLGLDPFLSSGVLAKYQRYGVHLLVPPNMKVDIDPLLIPH